MKRVPVLTPVFVISLTIFAVGTLAQKSSPPQEKISAAEILDKHMAAIGGVDALRALQTLHAHGSIGIPHLNSNGDFHFYYKAPNRDVFQLDLISHGQSSAGHNEGIPFVKHTELGVEGINGITLSVWEANCVALIESAFEQNYVRIELVGSTEVDGKWAYVLRFFARVGDPQIRYYDSQSFLMVRMDLLQRVRVQKGSSESTYIVETSYSDYRDFGSVRFPMRIRTRASHGDVNLDVRT
jgi:hypothetical protein